jgi:hypothetical protein
MNDEKIANKEQNKMRTVMIGSPSHDGKIEAWHVAALVETCKIGLANNINVIPIYMSYDALVQRARNDIAKLALESNVDDLFFIDSDVDWNPMDFFKMLNYDVDVVGAALIKKSEIQQYAVKITEGFKVEDNGLVEVAGVGTGMLRIRKDALIKIAESSEEYKEPHKQTPTKSIFEVKVIDGELWSEDIVFCKKWKDLGGKVYLDPMVNLGHSGSKRWVGNFYEWYKLISNR